MYADRDDVDKNEIFFQNASNFALRHFYLDKAAKETMHKNIAVLLKHTLKYLENGLDDKATMFSKILVD
jgi:hypothetical protein